jgi:YD repeat-containing protein
MIKSKIFLQILFVCLLFTSCDNEPYEGDFLLEDTINEDGDGNNDNDGNGGDDDDNPTEQALLVSQIDIQFQGNSEIYTIEYTYDSENRLLREDNSDGSFLKYNYDEERLVGTYSSNGIDNSEDIVEYYIYDAQGKVDAVTIDTQEETNPYTIRYDYSANNTVIEGARTLTGQLQERQSFALTGNIFRVENFNNGDVTSKTFMHNEMDGAFKNIFMREAISTINSENLPSSLLRFSLNNPTSLQLRENSVLTQTSNFSYTYNDDGYPASIIIASTNNGTTETSTYTLTYVTAQ